MKYVRPTVASRAARAARKRRRELCALVPVTCYYAMTRPGKLRKVLRPTAWLNNARRRAETRARMDREYRAWMDGDRKLWPPSDAWVGYFREYYGPDSYGQAYADERYDARRSKAYSAVVTL